MSNPQVNVSVYLPSEVYDRVRGLAFRQGRTKSDLLAEVIIEGLEQRKRGGERTYGEEPRLGPPVPTKPVQPRKITRKPVK